MSVTVNGVKIDTIVAEAKTAARIAAEQFFQEKLNGRDQFACGFAWVDIFGVKGNTKLGRALKEAGVRKSHTGAFQIWNPADMYVQNVDTLEAGAQAAADVFKKYGFTAFACSRLD
jgi:hypothetical protein